MEKNNYFISLDLFRGFCGYGVALSHFFAFAYSNSYSEYMSLIFAEFFFVLSGFVLYPQILKVINNKKNLFIFYKRRWMRTLPLYLVTLILISILTGQLFELDFLKYLFLVQKTIPNFVVNDYFPVVWHLSIEESFYLFFPLIVITMTKDNFITKVLYVFTFLVLSKFFISSYFDANFYRTGTFLRFDAILLGFIIAHYQVFLLKNKKIILSLLIILIPLYLLNFNFFVDGNKTAYIRFLFILFMQLLSAVVMLGFVLLEPIILNNNLKKFSLFISQQAYSIYLLHMIFIYIFKELNYSVLISSILYIMILFFTSTLVYKYFEEPIMKLRPKIL